MSHVWFDSWKVFHAVLKCWNEHFRNLIFCNVCVCRHLPWNTAKIEFIYSLKINIHEAKNDHNAEPFFRVGQPLSERRQLVHECWKRLLILLTGLLNHEGLHPLGRNSTKSSIFRCCISWSVRAVVSLRTGWRWEIRPRIAIATQSSNCVKFGKEKSILFMSEGSVNYFLWR